MPDSSHATVDILAPHDRALVRARNGRIGSAAAGLVLTGVAATRSNFLARALFGAAGTLLVARALTGLSVRQLAAFATQLFHQRKDLEKRFNDGEHDIVDAASFDSFPASDPPSYSPGAG